MFAIDRIFSSENSETGTVEWFFRAREGNAGPYETRNEAEAVLRRFIDACVNLGHKGGVDKILDML